MGSFTVFYVVYILSFFKGCKITGVDEFTTTSSRSARRGETGASDRYRVESSTSFTPTVVPCAFLFLAIFILCYLSFSSLPSRVGPGGPGGMPGGPGGPRPPPMRIPNNLPALQRLGQPGGAPLNEAHMGVGRGSLVGEAGRAAAAAASKLAAGGMQAGGMQAGGGAGGGAEDGGGGASINVYVGKLHCDVDNQLVEELLSCCGKVEKWNRAVDPSTDLPKAFGFCTYRAPQAAAVSVKVGDCYLLFSPFFFRFLYVVCTHNGVLLYDIQACVAFLKAFFFFFVLYCTSANEIDSYKGLLRDEVMLA